MTAWTLGNDSYTTQIHYSQLTSSQAHPMSVHIAISSSPPYATHHLPIPIPIHIPSSNNAHIRLPSPSPSHDAGVETGRWERRMRKEVTRRFIQMFGFFFVSWADGWGGSVGEVWRRR